MSKKATGEPKAAAPEKVTCSWACVDVIHRGSSTEARFSAAPAKGTPGPHAAHLVNEAYGQMGIAITNPELFSCFEPGALYDMEIKKRK